MTSNSPAEKSLSIGGPLIVLALFVVAGPFVIAHTFMEMNVPSAQNSWELRLKNITDKSQNAKLLTKSFFAVNLGLIAMQSAVAFYFFKRSRYFPGIYIFSRFVLLVVLVADFAVTESYLRSMSGRYWIKVKDVAFKELKGELPKDLGSQILMLGIWGPYLKLSRRSRATFVR